MTEQELRAAVAEYDAEMAQDAEYDYTSGSLRLTYCDSHKEWIINARGVSCMSGCYEQESDVLVSIAATMRAMDAAAKEFEASLKEGGK